MKVKVLRGFCLGGGRDVYPGDVIEVEDTLAKYFISRGKVEQTTDPISHPAEEDAPEVHHRRVKH